MNTEPWNIIFLDIDGVLVTENTGYQYFQQEPVDELKRILARTGARIVVSSAWRNDWSFKELQAIFGDIGINEDLIIGVTEDLITASRGTEISRWLQKHKDVWVKRYVVIDDEGYNIEAHADRLVEVETEKGLTAEDADKAIKLLTGL